MTPDEAFEAYNAELLAMRAIVMKIAAIMAESQTELSAQMWINNVLAGCIESLQSASTGSPVVRAKAEERVRSILGDVRVTAKRNRETH
jgi:hypothetical protein